MSYDLELDVQTLTPGGVFQDVERILGIVVGADARTPVDNDDYMVPQATPMAPVHTLASTTHADGNTHSYGTWMPIRRSLITAVTTTAVTVTDADPFHVGDVLHSIDATGPVTGGGVSAGIVSAVNYTTNVVTVENSLAAAAAGDWLEVLENGVATPVTPTRYMNPMTIGLMKDDIDLRKRPDDTTGQDTFAEVVVHGAIKEADINFSDDATDDLILIPQLGQWVPGGGVQIYTGTHGNEAVNVPDWSGVA